MEPILNIKPVSFTKVLKKFYEEHDLKKGTNKWAIKAIQGANKKFGYWVEAQLSKKTLLKILLPCHVHGEIKLISKKGASLKEAFKNLKKLKDYKKKCPECIKTIEYFKDKKIGHIYLSYGKISNLKDYNEMRCNEEDLVHLDGLHRLLSILYFEKIKNYSPIKCFIAMNNYQTLPTTFKTKKFMRLYSPLVMLYILQNN